MGGIRRLNHAVLFVSDLDRALAFYTDVMGFKLLSREDRFNAAFLRTAESTNHHDLGLFGLGPSAAPRQRAQVGLYHLAWQVDTLDDLAAMRTALTEADHLSGESSHGATLSVYGRDPDGNEFE
ncbi:MAG: VOC family protein, partial [Acidimicrobiia bacterium]|nr:VOC family protein [Acidimicrobiia bacterium]